MTNYNKTIIFSLGVGLIIIGSYGTGYRKGISNPPETFIPIDDSLWLADKPPLSDLDTAILLQEAAITYMSVGWIMTGETPELCVTLPLMVSYDWKKLNEFRAGCMKKGWLVRYEE